MVGQKLRMSTMLDFFAREVNDDPNSSMRIKELHRNDELEELAITFNEMLEFSTS